MVETGEWSVLPLGYPAIYGIQREANLIFYLYSYYIQTVKLNWNHTYTNIYIIDSNIYSIKWDDKFKAQTEWNALYHRSHSAALVRIISVNAPVFATNGPN